MWLIRVMVIGAGSMNVTGFLLFQRDVVTSYWESGKPVNEQEGVEDAFELIHEIPERVRTGLWVGDCFIYTNSAWRLNYCVGGEVSCDFREQVN